MNNDKGYTIYCSRCGEEMKSTDRYCMKCGNLNPDHPENQKIHDVIDKANKDSGSYVVGSGQTLIKSNNGSMTNTIATDIGNKTYAFLFPLLIYLFVIIITFIINYLQVKDIVGIVNTCFPFTTLIFTIIYLFVYAKELLYMKLNLRWWSSLIPIINKLELCKILFKNKWLGLLFCIPFINIIMFIIYSYKLGKSFKFNGILTVLFYPITLLIIGYGESLYLNRNYMDYSIKNSTEKSYKYKQTGFTIGVLLLLVSVAMLVYANINDVKNTGDFISKYYYVYSSKKITNDVKKKIDSNNYTCNGNIDFYFVDASDEFNLPFNFYMEPIEAIVKVRDDKYYISITNGNLGFDLTDIDEVTEDTIVEYSSLNIDFDIDSCILD